MKQFLQGLIVYVVVLVGSFGYFHAALVQATDKQCSATPSQLCESKEITSIVKTLVSK